MATPRPTLRLIASQCGCSRNTVSLALRNDPRVASDRAQHIRNVARALAYRPDPKVAQIMGHIASKGKGRLGKMGVLVGADFDRPDPWKAGSWLEQSHDGMSRRMAEYGYTFDCFWLGQPKMTPSRMRDIIKARGIDGLIVFSYVSAPAVIDFDFSEFAPAVIGRGLAHPRLHATGGNLHNDLDCVMRKATAAGYRRIGLALPVSAATRSLHCWEAAYQYHQVNLARPSRVPPCVFEPTRPRELETWLLRAEPDCVIGVAETYLALREFDPHWSKKIGFATLVQEPHLPEVAGIKLPHGLIASKAVDIVVENLRANRIGLPRDPELILYDGSWVDGPSLPGRTPRKKLR